MFKIVSYAAIIVVSLVATTAVQAKPPKTLAECYNLVIAGCNKTNHPQPCARGGMDDCDEIFPVPLVIDPGLPPRLGNLTMGD